jgi:hypothetical protein
MIVRPAGTVMSGSPQLVQNQQQQQQQQQQLQQQQQQQQLQQQQLTRVPVSSNIIRTGKRLLPVPYRYRIRSTVHMFQHHFVMQYNITYRDQG